MPYFIKHRDSHIDLISYMMLPIQFIKNRNKHNQTSAPNLYCSRERHYRRRHNRDWLAIRITNSFYRDGEIKGQI